MPGLTWETAHALRRDTSFDGRVDGHVYAQPLYWKPAGAAHGLIIVATENDVVAALDAETGRSVWQVTLGSPVSRAALPCGDVNPLGITGTPVIDPATGAIYLDAVVSRGGAPEHLVFGLRLSDGSVLPGWPVDVQQALQSKGIAFTPRQQNQRAALALFDGRVFVAFSGQFGDCGTYRGIVLGLATAPSQPVTAWETRGLKGGIWAPGGISSDGQALFVSTGNTDGAKEWADGEGVFRLGPDLAHSASPRDVFAPANWKALDDDDLDLAGVNPMPITLPGGARLLLALGKDGNAYLLNRDDLGGIGGQLAMRRAAGSLIITGPASYSWQRPRAGGLSGAPRRLPERPGGRWAGGHRRYRGRAGRSDAGLVCAAGWARRADRHHHGRHLGADRLGGRRRGRRPAARLPRRYRPGDLQQPRGAHWIAPFRDHPGGRRAALYCRGWPGLCLHRPMS